MLNGGASPHGGSLGRHADRTPDRCQGLSWLMDHRAPVRAPGPRPTRVRGRAPGALERTQICVVGVLTRYDVHPVREHRHSIDLVRYRFIGTAHIGLETVASTAMQTTVPRTAWRCRTAEAARARTVGGATSAWGPLR